MPSEEPLWPADPYEVRRSALLDRPFLTIGEASTVLEVSRWTIMRWIAEGRLSGEKVGRTKLIPTSTVRGLLDGRRQRKRTGREGRFSQLSESQVREIARVLAEVLEDGYMPVRADDLSDIIRGREHPGALFWSALIAGIERSRSRASRPQLMPASMSEPVVHGPRPGKKR